MVSKKIVKELQKSKNLLAFSAGIDSTALYYILLQNSIEFDIAIVDYNTRVESKQEVEYAHYLAYTHNKKIYTKSVKLQNSNFEKNARDIRYDFFGEIISHNNYDTLITAHQLNDKLEWFFMQFSKGAGVSTLLGMEEISLRDNYKVVKPLLNVPKQRLKEYLDKDSIRYFIDSSNSDIKYKRNYFRHNFTDKLLHEFEGGIIKSFEYLQEDKKELDRLQILFNKDKYYIISSFNDYSDIKSIDIILKRVGFLASKAQKDEILKSRDCVVGGKIAVVFMDNRIFIAPYKKIVMDKKFKEKMRVQRVPPKIRGYLYELNRKT